METCRLDVKNTFSSLGDVTGPLWNWTSGGPGSFLTIDVAAAGSSRGVELSKLALLKHLRPLFNVALPLTDCLAPPSGQRRRQKRLKCGFLETRKTANFVLVLCTYSPPQSGQKQPSLFKELHSQRGHGWGGGGRGPRFPAPPPPPSASPRGATMVMVIMSPLSELTDTDGFEMRSISQRAPPPGPGPAAPRVCQAPPSGVSSYLLTARPSSTA